MSRARHLWWLLGLAVFSAGTLAAALAVAAYHRSISAGDLLSAVGIGPCVTVGWAVGTRRRRR